MEGVPLLLVLAAATLAVTRATAARRPCITADRIALKALSSVAPAQPRGPKAALFDASSQLLTLVWSGRDRCYVPLYEIARASLGVFRTQMAGRAALLPTLALDFRPPGRPVRLVLTSETNIQRLKPSLHAMLRGRVTLEEPATPRDRTPVQPAHLH